MSGTAPVSPNTIDTTLIQDGQPPGAITPADIRIMEDSLSGLFAQTGFGGLKTVTDVMGLTTINGFAAWAWSAGTDKLVSSGSQGGTWTLTDFGTLVANKLSSGT